MDPRALHTRLLKSPTTNRSDHNNLITSYAKSNRLPYSLRVFHQISSPNIVSWTSLISAHANSTLALTLFLSMLRHPVFPNFHTFASLFKTCSALSRCLSFGISLHSLSHKLSLTAHPFTGSALISFYSKYGQWGNARKVFDEMPEWVQRDEVCYGALIVGLAQNSRPNDALSAFAQMKCCGVVSTVHSVTGALRAAAELVAWEQCRMLHGHSVVTGIDGNVFLRSALVDAYGKAGVVLDARQVFDENLEVMSIVGWNALMAGYAQQGDHESVMELFRTMEAQGLVPDKYTFLALLSAFSNAGLSAEAKTWIKRMEEEYRVQPGLEHYTSLLAAMGRSGKLDEAERIAKTMPFEPDAAVWRSLLSSCANHNAADMAKRMAKRLLELDPQDDSAYVIAANVLSAAGRWDEVAEVRKLMKDRRVKKEGGKSWIEVKGKIHIFLSGDQRHEMMEGISAKLAELMREIGKLGYVPVCDEMLHQVGEGEKREALLYHSEKLALAFGVLSGAAQPGKPLRIMKNLRICRDCHEAFKYMSRVVEREIIVSDVNRYHKFLDGHCSCGDFW